MALDNPSYFSLSNESDIVRRTDDLDAISTSCAVSNSSSECSLSRQLTPPKSQSRPLLRSLSSNSADSNQELFIMGEPRVSDIAPDIAKRYAEPRRANSLKNTKKAELQCNDLLYFPLPTTEDAIISEQSGDQEVFISDDSARYYNFAAISNSKRRHSISAFITRERSSSVASCSKSFKEDFPQAIVHATAEGHTVAHSSSISIDEHSLRHGSYPRKRCQRCTKKPMPKRADMDDILIISVKESEAATLWVDYFNSYFQHICQQANRKPFKIYHLAVEEIVEAATNVKIIQERTSGVKLQLIVMCPSLLEIIALNPTTSGRLGKIIVPDRTLALLLGVSDEDLTTLHRNALATYSQWQRLSVGLDQDETFTKEFLGTAVNILSRVWKQQTSISPQQKPLFSVLPKKVRQGHSSVVIILTHPLQREDIVKVSVERNNEIVEIKSVKRRNPYTLKITIPDSCTEISAIVHILVEKNGSIIGSSPIKCESRLRELEQILRSSENPVEFMCQALGFSPANKEHMDNCLLYSFQKNMPPNFNLLFNSTTAGANKYAHRHSHEEYPTLLHFAARYGLEKLAMQLLDCPGGDSACDIRNSCDLSPAEIAQNSGHTELAHILSGYMKMNEFKDVYEKLKEMSKESNPVVVDEEDDGGYLSPTEINNYKVCPPPKPFNPVQSNLSNEKTPPMGYLTMNVPVKATGTNQSINTNIKNKNASKLNLNLNLPSTSSQTDLFEKSSPSTSAKGTAIYEDKVQRELLEIITDFKNHVHSITQVEKLVAEWKNRNDVQMSFKEKQDQLNEMRLRYEKIQQDMKSSMKKPTPFERVKKLFFKGKSKDESKTDVRSPPLGVYTPTSGVSYASIQNQRPISSLSLQSTSSSGSSGRMSTISGCSIGDSGTHSDQEERKTMLGHVPDEDFRSELSKAIMNLNYTVPPPPRPYNPVKFSAKHQMFPTIEERPPQPVPRPSNSTDDLYYIEFPPSGLPVQGLDHLKLKQNEQTTPETSNKKPIKPLPEEPTDDLYMNLPANKTLDNNVLDTEEFHEYINYVPPTN